MYGVWEWKRGRLRTSGSVPLKMYILVFSIMANRSALSCIVYVVVCVGE